MEDSAGGGERESRTPREWNAHSSRLCEWNRGATKQIWFDRCEQRNRATRVRVGQKYRVAVEDSEVVVESRRAESRRRELEMQTNERAGGAQRRGT